MPLTITAASTEFISLTEVKAHANVPATATAHNDELNLFRGAAEEAVQGIIGPVLHRTVTESVHASRGVVLLRYSPVVSVTSLTASGTAVTYTLDVAAGVLRDVNTYGKLDVTYVAGRTVVPDSVRVAGLIIAAHLWETQKGNAPSSGGALPDTGEDGFPGFGMAYSIPNRARDLLMPYALPPAVA